MTAKPPSREREAERTTVADSTAAVWHQMCRIENNLPQLYRQREATARRLEEITDLRADEEAAVAETRATVR